MFEIIKSEIFERWSPSLKDLRRASGFRCGSTVWLTEIRVIPSLCRALFQSCALTMGHGYRLYFTRRGPLVIVLLAGGDKRTKDGDIERAIAIANEWKD